MQNHSIYRKKHRVYTESDYKLSVDFQLHGGWALLTVMLFKVSYVGLALFWAPQSTSVKKQEKVSGQGKRQIVVYTYSGILFSLIKERNSTVCAANMDEG